MKTVTHTLVPAVFTALIARSDEVSNALRATPTATIEDGTIIGTTTNIVWTVDSTPTAIPVNQFFGIPYAAAPTGQARFLPPQPPAKWPTPLLAQKFSNSCIQVFSNPQTALLAQSFTKAVFNNPPPLESEDCLYLNVFAPRNERESNGKPYPVMYWLYGGSWQFGNAGQPWYDGSHFAALEDVIVVTVNYRTNVFGLPQTSAIDKTKRNVGVLDQRAGLAWIQTNIQHFGGDPGRVTIFGESAGAYSVDLLLTSYSSSETKLPFHAAIMQSGSYAYHPAPQSILCNTETSAWDNLTALVGCTNSTTEARLTCMRDRHITSSQLRKAQEDNLITFGHTCDEETVVSNPRTRLEAGDVARVPTIIGSNTWDGSFYSISSGNDVDGYFNVYFPGNTALKERVVARYNGPTEVNLTNQTMLRRIHTDWFFHCPAVYRAQTSATVFPNLPTYRYLFNSSFTNTRAQWPLWSPEYQGAYHTSEIPIVFSSYSETLNSPGTSELEAEKRLSDAMRGAWASFARDPSKKPLNDWDAVVPGSATARFESAAMSFGSDGLGEWNMTRDGGLCGFWAELGFRTLHS